MTSSRRAHRNDVVLATNPDAADLDRAAAVSRVARSKGTVPPALAAIRRECIARARGTGTALAVIAGQLGVTVPRVIQLLADYRNREGADRVGA